MLPPTTVPNNTTSGSQNRPSTSALPAPGNQVQAVVRSVASGDTSGQVFRIQVEANNRLLELVTRAPLANGDRINLSRTPGGELQIQLPTQGNQGQPAANAGANINRILLNVAQQNSAQIMQSLPLNTPKQAQVTQSVPLTISTPPAQGSNAGANPAGTAQQPSANTPTPGQAGGAQTNSATTGAASSNNPAATGSQARPSPSTAGSGTPPAGAAQTSGTSAASQTGSSSPPAANAQTPAQGRASVATGGSGNAAANTSASSGNQAAQTQPPTASAPQLAAKAQVYRAQITQINAMPTGGANSNTQTPAPTGTPAQGQAAQTSPPPGTTAQNNQSPPAAKPPTPPSTNAQSNNAQTTSGTTTARAESTPAQPQPAAVTQKGQQLARSLGMQQPPPAPTQHQVQLNLAGERISLISPRPLMVGQQVVLTRTDAQQVSLSPAPQAQQPLQQSVQQPAVQQALRDALPQQIPFGDALNQMMQLSQSPAARNQSAVTQLVQSMLSLFGVSPGSEDAGEAVKRNLQQGGLLTEARLGQASADKAAPQADLKQQLGQLLKAAEQLPEGARQQMTRLIDALQARSTSQQVSSLQAWKEQPDGSMERAYRLDLPIRQAERFENAELTITERRERQPDGDMLSLWSAALHFDLDEHGSVDARLSLQEGWRLQLQFWAEEPQTQRLINQRLDPFTDNLHQQGFLVENVQVHAGRPTQPELNDIQRRLVDVHT